MKFKVGDICWLTLNDLYLKEIPFKVVIHSPSREPDYTWTVRLLEGRHTAFHDCWGVFDTNVGRWAIESELKLCERQVSRFAQFIKRIEEK